MEPYIRVGWRIVLSIILKSKGVDNSIYHRRLNHLYSIGIWGRYIYAQIVRNVTLTTVRSSQPDPVKKSSKQPDTKPTPSVVASTRPNPKTKMSKTILENKIGESIVLKLTAGLYFVLLWIDTKLDNDTVELKVSDNGKMVIKRTKKPTDNNAILLLWDLGYGFDKKHVVTANLQDELDRLLKDRKEEWDEESLIVMEEEVVREFVDEDGTPTKNIGYSPDKDGRFRVSFFLQSVKHNMGTPLKFKLANPRHADDVDFEDQTVSDIDEVRYEIKGLARTLDEAMAASNKRVREEMQFDMRNMMEQLVQVLRSPEQPQQHQQHQQQYPDQAFSSWTRTDNDDVLRPLIEFGKEVERELSKFS